VACSCIVVGAGMTVAVMRTEHTASDLRRQVAGTGDAAVARRLLALALVVDGRKRADAARLAGMDRQTLRDWVHRTNADGVAQVWRTGMAAVPSRGCQRSRRPKSRAGYGPALAKNKVVRWRCTDIQSRIAKLFGVALHERSVGRHRGAERQAPAGGPRPRPLPDRRGGAEAVVPGVEPIRERVDHACP